MSHPGYPPAQPAAFDANQPVPPARPATLTYGFFGALLSGLLSAVGAILLIAQAHDLAQKTAADILGSDTVSALGSELTGDVVDEAASTLTMRGISGLVSAALVLAFALAARNGALWARIVLTVFVVGAACANGFAASDVAPAASKVLDVAAIVLGIVAIVLLYLPATGRYAKARKQRTA